MNPQIVTQDYGIHNSLGSTDRLKKHAYKDMSTICIVPSFEYIHAKVVQYWMGLMPPMNQKFIRIFALGMEVGAAYSSTIDMILQHQELSKWKYILTLEHDNCPQPDALLKIYDGMDKFDAIGGLYYTKGEYGKPMCYGKHGDIPVNFIPFEPEPETLTQCNGLGMGFTLFKMDIFKNPALPKPFFETVQKFTPGVGAQAFTQDLKFFLEAGKLGYKFACDSRVKVGHYAADSDIMW